MQAVQLTCDVCRESETETGGSGALPAGWHVLELHGYATAQRGGFVGPAFHVCPKCIPATRLMVGELLGGYPIPPGTEATES